MVYKGATDYIKTNLCTKKGGEPQNTQRQKVGDTRKEDTKEQEETERQKISIIHTQNQGEEKNKKDESI